jgi:hypothetical protein
VVVARSQQLQPTNPKNNLKQKFNPENKPQRKNPIGKATTTTNKKTEINSRKEKGYFTWNFYCQTKLRFNDVIR